MSAEVCSAKPNFALAWRSNASALPLLGQPAPVHRHPSRGQGADVFLDAHSLLAGYGLMRRRPSLRDQLAEARTVDRLADELDSAEEAKGARM